jgi:hypothetical protein
MGSTSPFENDESQTESNRHGCVTQNKKEKERTRMGTDGSLSHAFRILRIGHADDADADADADGCEDATDATSDGVRRRCGGAHGGVCVVWIIVVVVVEEEEWTRTNE